MGILVADMGMEMVALDIVGIRPPASKRLWRFEVLKAAVRIGPVREMCMASLGHLAYLCAGARKRSCVYLCARSQRSPALGQTLGPHLGLDFGDCDFRQVKIPGCIRHTVAFSVTAKRP